MWPPGGPHNPRFCAFAEYSASPNVCMFFLAPTVHRGEYTIATSSIVTGSGNPWRCECVHLKDISPFSQAPPSPWGFRFMEYCCRALGGRWWGRLLGVLGLCKQDTRYKQEDRESSLEKCELILFAFYEHFMQGSRLELF